MYRLFESLRPLIRLAVRRPGLILLASAILTGLALTQASRLTIDTDLAILLPREYPSVQALERLEETLGGETLLDVGIRSPSFEANRRFAEDLIPRVMELRTSDGQPRFARYDFYRDTTFLATHGLYLATEAELDALERFLEDRIEQARLAANPFYFDIEDDVDDGPEEARAVASHLAASLDPLMSTPYFTSPDSTHLVVRFLPTGSRANLGFVRETYDELDAVLAELHPGSYHPDMEAAAAGRLLSLLVEIETVTNDVRRSFGAGVLAVLLFVTLYFLYKAVQARGLSRRTLLSSIARTPVTALLLGLPLAVSLVWTFGIAYLAFGSLNLMTSTLALVLFGLGIDYGIHFYARYAEERGRHRAMEDAAETAFMSTGQAVAVSALTTAGALFALQLADFRGFSEFGAIGGTGILLSMTTMLIVLPALLVLSERIGLLRLKPEGALRMVGSPGPFPAARAVLTASLLATLLAVALLPNERFEYDFDRLEPDFPALDERQRLVSPAFSSSTLRNPAYLVVDTPQQALAVADSLRKRMAIDTTIAAVETPVERFPLTPAAAERRLARLTDVRRMAGDVFLSADESGQIERMRRAASTDSPLSLADLPDDVRRRFTDRAGEIGRFVVVYPRGELSRDGRLSMAFAARVGRVNLDDGTTAFAGSTAIVAAEMLRLMLEEAPWMVAITLLLIAAMMLLIFRSIKWGALALLPLVVGVMWMLGGMAVAGIAFTFYNIVVLPAVLGIGNDCGVHLVHRYREEGRGSLVRLLRTTGEHITVGALTTMMGFSGLLFSFHPGLRSIGQLAVLGIGATLLAALIFFPALLQWIEDRSTHGVSEVETRGEQLVVS